MTLNVKKICATLGAGAGIVFILVQNAFAAPPINTTPIGNSGININPLRPNDASGPNDLINMVGNIILWVLWIIGILAVLYLVYGGVLYITAGGDAEKAGKGRTAITNAIIGIIIIVLALAIYSFVVGSVA